MSPHNIVAAAVAAARLGSNVRVSRDTGVVMLGDVKLGTLSQAAARQLLATLIAIWILEDPQRTAQVHRGPHALPRNIEATKHNGARVAEGCALLGRARSSVA